MAGSNVAGNMILAPLVMIYDIDNKRFMGYGQTLASSDLNNQEPLREMNEMAELMEDKRRREELRVRHLMNFPPD